MLRCDRMWRLLSRQVNLAIRVMSSEAGAHIKALHDTYCST